MNPQHLPQTDSGIIIHVMEECAEVIKVCSKILRFGMDNYNPTRPEDGTNREKIKGEIEDLRHAIFRMERLL